MIAANTAALLGTSPPDEPITRYTFDKTGVEGVAAVLTHDAPLQRFVVTIRAEELGPRLVETTTDASVRLYGSVTTSELDEGAPFPFVAVRTGSSGKPDRELQVLKTFDLSDTLVFEGDCSTPTEGTPCEAQLSVELARLDQGEGRGQVVVQWSLDLHSEARQAGDAPDQVLEAPWSVEFSPE